MICAIDFDNVLNNLAEKTLEIYNKQSGKDIKMTDITTYDFYDCLPKADADGIVKLFKNKSLWDSLTPIIGAREGLQKLLDAGHRVYIVTATAPENFNWKIQFVKKYFPFINPDNVVRLMDKSLFKCDILIEDNIDQLIKTKSARHICFDYPWNDIDGRDYIYDIYRCKNWPEIVETVNKIQKEHEEWARDNM